MKYLKLFPWQVAAAAVAVVIGMPLAAQESGPSGVPRFRKVDEHVYRGGQPTEDGFQNLAKLGVKTILDLREEDSRSAAEQKAVTAAGMRYVAVPMQGMQRPTDASMVKALNLLEDSSSGPVFVHCKRGADRTGDVIACYRVEHDHWQNTKALAEARSIGMSWFQQAIQHYVLSYRPRVLDASKAIVAAGTATAAPVLSAAAPAAALP